MLSDLLLASSWIWGFHCFMDYSDLGYLIDLNLKERNKWMLKPFFTCPPCMSSVHGTLAFVYFGHSGILNWVVFCFCLCGINFVIKSIIFK